MKAMPDSDEDEEGGAGRGERGLCFVTEPAVEDTRQVWSCLGLGLSGLAERVKLAGCCVRCSL